jgi:hypothetical protein
MRKWKIKDEAKDVRARIWWLEERYGLNAIEGNEGNQSEIKVLKEQYDCLIKARHVKGKKVYDCEPE